MSNGNPETLAVTSEDGLAVVMLQRGKVNALNRAVLDSLTAALDELARDASVRAVVLTGRGSFFSFGFDVPEVLPYSRDEFREFLSVFTSLYTSMFLFPKPLVAAMNGHAVAGGCMLSLTCDRRIMTRGTYKVALNEITFGATIFAGMTEILRFAVGSRAATEILLTGRFYDPDEALAIGLIDETCASEALASLAAQRARAMAAMRPEAFARMKMLLREPVVEAWRAREADSVEKFIEIWYSEPTRTNLRSIVIR